ncbi:MAG TPA: efflux RND transporter periplasmic adaptor subunit [Pyrinomonadaceae bacterium]|nr:efflux RND transporter periplasmic adaptor subunit [Pyrinomonadaceae bacterium]
MTNNQGLRSRVRLLLYLAGLSAVLISGCANKAAQNFERPPARVSVSEALAQDVPTYLDAIGKTVAREVVSVQPQVSGRITKIHFTDGANVQKGQLLFTIDTRPFEANVKQAQANLSKDEALKKQAEANLAREIAQAKWGVTQVNRYRALAESGVVSQEQYGEIRANLDTLNANVGAARAAVRSADEVMKVDAAAIESAKVELSYCFIRSPIDGRAGQRLVDLGNVVNPGGPVSTNSSNGGTGNSSTGNSSALVVIERLDPIYADFTISQDNLTQVQVQMREGTLRAEVRLPDDPENHVTGQLTFLDNAVQDATGTVNLRATIPNDGHRFWPGRFVNVRLVLSTIHQAVLIPANAPQMSAKGSFVYVVKQDSTAEQRQVTLGQRQQDLVVVESGVQPGERVVTNGQLGVTPGGKVAVEQPRDANAPAATSGGSK